MKICLAERLLLQMLCYPPALLAGAVSGWFFTLVYPTDIRPRQSLSYK
jgi:hypothetical protein